MGTLNKRQFIKTGLAGACGLYCMSMNKAAGSSFSGSGDLWKYSHESMFYTVTPRGVRCELCPNHCNLSPGETGDCNNRVNSGGKLYSIAYGNPCAVHIDPVEKKPLLHFYPSTRVFSIATAGCNFVCLNCQNWEISQTSPYKTKNTELFPPDLVKSCMENKCPSIAYTYSEPVTFYEYMFDTSKIAHEKGVKNILVSNGYINNAPLRKLAPYLDAANIDLKSFSDDIYLRLSAGKLQPVLNTLKILKDEGVWLEITNLIVPSWTDDLDMIKQMCDWLVTNGFSDFPLHFSRFHPAFKLTQLPMTPVEILIKARDIAMKSGCNYVYIGNVPGKNFENTYCPDCKKLVIERRGFVIISKSLKNGACENCGKIIAGRW